MSVAVQTEMFFSSRGACPSGMSENTRLLRLLKPNYYAWVTYVEGLQGRAGSAKIKIFDSIVTKVQRLEFWEDSVLNGNFTEVVGHQRQPLEVRKFSLYPELAEATTAFVVNAYYLHLSE
jgi:hypothetical protein